MKDERSRKEEKNFLARFHYFSPEKLWKNRRRRRQRKYRWRERERESEIKEREREKAREREKRERGGGFSRLSRLHTNARERNGWISTLNSVRLLDDEWCRNIINIYPTRWRRRVCVCVCVWHYTTWKCCVLERVFHTFCFCLLVVFVALPDRSTLSQQQMTSRCFPRSLVTFADTQFYIIIFNKSDRHRIFVRGFCDHWFCRRSIISKSPWDYAPLWSSSSEGLNPGPLIEKPSPP